MKLGEKIRYLREVEGSLRGLNRGMSQPELVRAIKAETGSDLSQSYVSQIESGARPHLTNKTRQILATFFKVHPGYLVDDPEGYSPELQSELRTVEDKLDMWLVAGAERFRRDPELKQALLTLAQHEHTRECLLLMESILETPGLVARLTEVTGEAGNREQGTGNRSGKGQSERGTRKRSAQMITFYFVCFLAGLMLSAVMLLGGMGHFGGHAHLHIPHAHVHIPHGPHLLTARNEPARAAAAEADSLVEQLLADDLSLLVRRGGLSAYPLRQFCYRRGAGAGGYLRRGGRSHRVPVPDQSADAARSRADGGRNRCGGRGGPHHLGYPRRRHRRDGLRAARSKSIRARAQRGRRRISRAQEEVFVVRYEKGIAYVRKWDEGRD